MNQKTAKIAGYVVTGLLTAMVAFGGFMQLMGGPEVTAKFHTLQIDNLMMMRFLGFMKVIGAVGLWVPRARAWAVHGFTFLFVGALATHLGAGDPASEFVGATICLSLLGASEFFANKANGGTAFTGTMTTGQRRAA